jgi:hypothetical protein
VGLAWRCHCLRAIGYFYFVAWAREVYVILRTPCVLSQLAEWPTIWRGVLASRDSHSEDVRVLSVVVAELKFGNIERHIFAAHFMERADHAALENRPKALDGLAMDRADDILPSGVIDDAMRNSPSRRL